MDYKTWSASVPEEIRNDPLWKMEAYRLALFACDLGWRDVTKLCADKRTLDLAGQLYRALGSIEANIAEGYSRGGGRDRARFYEYALGSARETRGWFYKGRYILGEPVANHRIGLITQITRLLLTMVPDQRHFTNELKEEAAVYQASGSISSVENALSCSPEADPHLIQNIPLP